jgi:hypothetical protein
MPALIHNITIEKGADFQCEFLVSHPETGEAFDFTDYTSSAPLINRAGTTVAEFTVTLSLGVVLIAMTPEAEAELVEASNYNHRYTVRVSSPDDPDFRIAQGMVRVA